MIVRGLNDYRPVPPLETDITQLGEAALPDSSHPILERVGSEALGSCVEGLFDGDVFLIALAILLIVGIFFLLYAVFKDSGERAVGYWPTPPNERG